MLCNTGGETVAIASELPWAGRIISRGVGEASAEADAAPSIRLTVSADTAPFSTAGCRPITRGTSSDGVHTVMANAGGSGFDLRLTTIGDVLDVEARYRPSAGVRAANRVLGSRFELLSCQVLVHYPVLWRSGWRGRAPLHASVLATRAGTPLLAGPGGVGKSTVLTNARRDGATAIGDNLCAADRDGCFGVAEPLRTDGGSERGAKTSHGRLAQPFGERVAQLKPDRIVVLERGAGTVIEPITAEDAARTLVAGTYAAGELRRYWAFAATLALATGRGPAHPPITEIAAALTQSLPCLRVRIGDGQTIPVEELCGTQALAQKGVHR